MRSPLRTTRKSVLTVAAAAIALPVGIGLAAGPAQASTSSGAATARPATAVAVSASGHAVAAAGKAAPCGGPLHRTQRGLPPGTGGQSATGPVPDGPPAGAVVESHGGGAPSAVPGGPDAPTTDLRQVVIAGSAPGGAPSGDSEFGMASCDEHGGQVFAVHIGRPAGGGQPVLTIAEVQGGPAAAAGLRAGDVIQSIDGAAPVTNGKPDQAVIDRLLPPETGSRTVSLVVHRPSTGRTWTVTLKLQAPPGASAHGKPEIHRFASPATPGESSTDTAPDSPPDLPALTS
jgi:hypothetical protein